LYGKEPDHRLEPPGVFMHFRHLTPVVLLGLGGCLIDNTAPEPTDQPFETALAGAAGGVGSYSSLGTSASAFPVALTTFPIAQPSADACNYEPVTAFFVCPAFTRDAITMKRTFQLLDSLGNTQPTKDPLAAYGIRGVTDWSGAVTLANAVVNVTRHEDATVTNVRSSPRTFSGMSVTHYEADFGGGFTQMFDDTSRTTDFSVPSALGSYPTGIIETQTTMTSMEPSFTVPLVIRTTQVMRFNGTNILSVELTNGSTGVITNCGINLLTRIRNCG
jgi:hypothetical protein